MSDRDKPVTVGQMRDLAQAIYDRLGHGYGDQVAPKIAGLIESVFGSNPSASMYKSFGGNRCANCTLEYSRHLDGKCPRDSE